MNQSLFRPGAVLLVFLFVAANGFSQTRSRMPHIAPWQSEKHTVPNVLWLDLSLGSALTKNERYGIMGGINFHYLTKTRRHIQFRYNYTGSLNTKAYLNYDVSDAGYLFGWLVARRFMVMEFAFGVSCVFGSETTTTVSFPGYSYNSHRDPFVTVGLPVELDIKPMCFHYFGLGIAVKGNLNPRRSYIGVGLELSLHGPNQRRVVVKE